MSVCMTSFLLKAGHVETGRKGLYLALCITPLKLEPITTMQTSAAAQVAEHLPTMSQALGLISSTA